MSDPRATVRLQFHHDFTLDDAVGLVPYFAALGISHIYASPLLSARKGSPHGYDVVDHAHINPELGGEDALRRLVAALRRDGMGLIVDIVPNHMAVGGDDNAWWLSVLEWGTLSPYARFFDIDWRSSDPTLRGRVLAPFLGRPYAACMEAGEIALRFDADTGRLFAAYFHHRFPIAPTSYGAVLRNHEAFGVLAQAFDSACASRRHVSSVEELHLALRNQAATEAGAEAMRALLEAHDATTSTAGSERLHKLLDRQNYRLAWWRLSADRINWRRFFDVNDLAALQADRLEVFDATHALTLDLYARGLIDGVRVDHIDGLTDPEGYCKRLRRRLHEAQGSRPAGAPSGPPYIVVEKILEPGEALRAAWRVDGTTGYDFMNDVSAVQHDPAGEAALTRMWSVLSGGPADFEDEAHAAKPEILRRSFAGEFEATFAALARLAGEAPAWRDTPLAALRNALTVFLVHLPVYRLYGVADLDSADRAVLARTLRAARCMLPPSDRRGLRFIASVLARPESGAVRNLQRLAVLRIHKLSAPLTAKSVEDTAFYRYGRLLSRNEVGASPAQFALSPTQFHAACAHRRTAFPGNLLATATHDHKRGEDARARLAVLSEIPAAWSEAVRGWIDMNAASRASIGTAPAPAPADEFMLYQMIAGAWPLDLQPDDRPALQVFAERLAGWQLKALREAKQRTSWQAPCQPYEEACRRFLTEALLEHDAFRLSLHRFVQRIAAAGAINSLAQTLLRMTVPGVPDLYQGAELWDFSLVDPDNRRPVDYATRREHLARLAPSAPLDGWRDGAIKLHVIAKTLGLRRQRPQLFARGEYTPLHIQGALAAHVIAFERTHGKSRAVAIATRLPLGMQAELAVPLVPPELWRGALLHLPGTAWRNVLTGETLMGEDGRLLLRDALATMPIALLEPMPGTA